MDASTLRRLAAEIASADEDEATRYKQYACLFRRLMESLRAGGDVRDLKAWAIPWLTGLMEAAQGDVAAPDDILHQIEQMKPYVESGRFTTATDLQTLVTNEFWPNSEDETMFLIHLDRQMDMNTVLKVRGREYRLKWAKIMDADGAHTYTEVDGKWDATGVDALVNPRDDTGMQSQLLYVST